MAEDALGALAKGREAEADRLIEEAKKLDESSLVEVVEDLDEDAGSDPNAAKKSPGSCPPSWCRSGAPGRA
ncbi:hypothetical protein [Siccirubricoccus sp. G192]|uniref:hypothetical protein n=1 Tax=Siccirubricoccus sp. G192 TaxID=2849651 RepID=UPI001C2C60BE|nr:hypothetical protein [Siccirubricoccus sp. G192]MBV1798710.1 hypothetical protein [Siccirubricoccus sp. G192]